MDGFRQPIRIPPSTPFTIGDHGKGPQMDHKGLPFSTSGLQTYVDIMT